MRDPKVFKTVVITASIVITICIIVYYTLLT